MRFSVCDADLDSLQSLVDATIASSSPTSSACR
jgi:hypothetical protein